MEVLGIRFCSVTPEAQQLASFLDSLGLSRREIHAASEPGSPPEPFAGAVFPTGSGWIEVWPEGPELPAGVLLQIVVDDATAFAALQWSQGEALAKPRLEVLGRTDLLEKDAWPDGKRGAGGSE